MTCHAERRQAKREKYMATRTAPAVATANVNKVTSTLHLIDASGDLITVALVTPDALTDAEIEAWAAAYQAVTQASLYKVSVTNEWVGTATPVNADTDQRNSVKDGINFLYNNITTLKSQTSRLVAPELVTMIDDSDIPDLTAAGIVALVAAEEAILVGYDLQSAQYTERRERSNNPRVRP